MHPENHPATNTARQMGNEILPTPFIATGLKIEEANEVAHVVRAQAVPLTQLTQCTLICDMMDLSVRGDQAPAHHFDAVASLRGGRQTCVRS